MQRVIHWFRRDLRVTDNTALFHARKKARELIPVFILENALRSGPDVGAGRLAFLLQSLEELSLNLKKLGYSLVLREGKSEVEIPRLAKEIGAEAVFSNKRYEPYAQQRDDRVFNALNRLGIGFEQFKDAVIWEEKDILNQSGQPYTVFTPYSKAWRAKTFPLPFPALPKATETVEQLTSAPLVTDPSRFGHPLNQQPPQGGEGVALDLLNQFIHKNLLYYKQKRDFPALDGSSRLSPHFRAGTIGIRTVLHAVIKARRNADPAGQESCDTFVSELIWREFYQQILHNFPHVMHGSFRAAYDTISWEGDPEHFTAWQLGQTGYPIVDAAMRCMNATGWMHNRLRMITAMFLVKDLLIDWRAGERYFMKQLVDGDLAANNGGWQWCAGTGTDAAPYFRIFNPTTQGKKCDPEGTFIRHWLPELRDLPGNQIHEPWEAPMLTHGYPQRIVLHELQRPKTLAAYGKVAKR
ncbi:MAG: deoxyribodipyrimidine photo-lyase [Verrucomicrobiota bacterium]|nr:deoxyribodipyrimidine photo-lyase [Verrucomicrobiota bacterium]